MSRNELPAGAAADAEQARLLRALTEDWIDGWITRRQLADASLTLYGFAIPDDDEGPAG
jgi:hypothetical protein